MDRIWRAGQALQWTRQSYFDNIKKTSIGAFRPNVPFCSPR